MPDDASTSPPAAPPAPTALSYRGRLGRQGYWLGMAIAGLLLIVAFFAFVHASTPTATSDTAPLVLMLLPLFFWIHSLVTVKRLRDAGLPAWHYAFYVLGPIAWLVLVGGQASGSLGPVILLVGFAVIFFLPGFFKSKPDAAAEAKAV